MTVGTDKLDPHYKAEVLADSISLDGVRLTTFKLTYPRFIHSEMMTHRDKSRNAASSRAIPTERLIKQVYDDPFVPATFNKRVKGMGVGDALEDDDAEAARQAWLGAAVEAAVHAEQLLKLDVDKSRANRLLEPFLWYTAIFSGTEWDNMLGLRDHPAAQPEIQAVARCMRAAFAESEPVELEYNMWHLPLVTRTELDYLCQAREADSALRGFDLAVTVENLKKISASRCARVSFDRDDDEPFETTIARADMLMTNGHFSPFEHVARPMHPSEATVVSQGGGHPEESFCGNFRGWVQMRKQIPNESRFDLLLEDHL